ncbi:MAG: type II toxin-antitoxin system RelE/ParE family toxin [Actinobacteria bacterium]|nr:type II toxin-antitoxin system RelE/ParE family toxin [Actinomycetota bacterium]
MASASPSSWPLRARIATSGRSDTPLPTRCGPPPSHRSWVRSPRIPSGLGKPLLGEGLRSARRGDYRIIYEIFEDEQVVLIHRVQHRRDIYRPR